MSISTESTCEIEKRGVWRVIYHSLLCVLIPLATYGAARPLPESVDLRVLVKQEPGNLRVLVRAPLSVIRDTSFPLKDDVGHLDLNAVQIVLPSAARYWIQRCLQVYENHERVTDIEIVKARISPFSDDSFQSFESASAYFSESRNDNGVEILWDQASLDIDFKYSTEGNGQITILPDVANLGVHVATQLQYVGSDQSAHEFAFDGNPGLMYLTPRPVDIGKQFIAHGISFISRSADIALFIFCLVLPFRAVREVRYVAVTFAASLSIGLILPAFDLLPTAIWLSPLLATISAIAVLIAGLMNIGGIYPARRAMLAATAGLVFGATGWLDWAARKQFAGAQSQIAALAYWAGLMLATQLGIILLIPLIARLFKASNRRLELIVVSCLAADAALGWLEERWFQLRKIPWPFSMPDAGFFALLFAVLAFATFASGVLWFFRRWWASRRSSDAIHAKHEDIVS